MFGVLRVASKKALRVALTRCGTLSQNGYGDLCSCNLAQAYFSHCLRESDKIEGLDLELRQVNETQDDSASLERWPLLGQGPNSILAFPDGVHVAACARFCELP